MTAPASHRVTNISHGNKIGHVPHALLKKTPSELFEFNQGLNDNHAGLNNGNHRFKVRRLSTPVEEPLKDTLASSFTPIFNDNWY